MVAVPGSVVLTNVTRSVAAFDMPAPKEHITGEVKRAIGELLFDANDITKTRGNIQFDLTELRTHTFEDKAKNDSQSEHARTWLQAVVEGNVNESFRYATFTVKNIDSSASSLVAMPVTRRGEVRFRMASARVTGDFSVHGKTVEKTIDVTFKLVVDATDRPTSLAIETNTPFVVTLAHHDVKPRDSFGILAKSAFSILGTKVAEAASTRAEITFSLPN